MANQSRRPTGQIKSFLSIWFCVQQEPEWLLSSLWSPDHSIIHWHQLRGRRPCAGRDNSHLGHQHQQLAPFCERRLQQLTGPLAMVKRRLDLSRRLRHARRGSPNQVELSFSLTQAPIDRNKCNSFAWSLPFSLSMNSALTCRHHLLSLIYS